MSEGLSPRAVNSTLLHYGRPSVDDEDIAAVVSVLHGDWLTTGPTIGRFEEALAERVGARFAVVVSSGTAALHAAYHAAGVGPDDEVLTSPLTFAATANAALFLGARPVFADVLPETGNLDPERARAAVTGRTRVITPVDFAGHPADLDTFRALAREFGAVLVEDAAHSLGARYRGRPVGSIADMTCFSFHPVKHITTGEGGAITTDDEVLYDRLRRFRSHGIVRDPARQRELGAWINEMHDLGYNYRLTDFQAALGLSQLRKLDRFLARRGEIWRRYTESLQDERLILPGVAADVDPAWHLYVLRVADPRMRRPLFDALRQAEIGVQVHYLPVYRHPYYREIGYADTRCEHAEAYYDGCLSLPLHPGLTNADVDEVIEVVLSAIDCLTN